MKKTINCADCGDSFSYEPHPHFKDNRKYCDKCGAIRKAEFQGTNGDVKPEVEKISGAVKAKSSGDNTDWEIGNRKVRLHALASAIEWVYKSDTMAQSDIMNLAKQFEKYILTGK